MDMEELVTKLKVWHRVQGHIHMVKMLSGEETAEDYVNDVEQKVKNDIAGMEGNIKKFEAVIADPRTDRTERLKTEGRLEALKDMIEHRQTYLTDIQEAKKFLKVKV